MVCGHRKTGRPTMLPKHVEEKSMKADMSSDNMHCRSKCIIGVNQIYTRLK